MKVFVSGSFDPLHSGHIAFFESASKYGDLYVGTGSDESISKYKHSVYLPEKERLYMLKAIKYIKGANINPGMGNTDFEENPFFLNCDILVANDDQDSMRKEVLCNKYNKKYIVLKRKPAKGLKKRTSTEIRNLNKNTLNLKVMKKNVKNFRFVKCTNPFRDDDVEYCIEKYSIFRGWRELKDYYGTHRFETLDDAKKFLQDYLCEKNGRIKEYIECK